MTNKETSNQNDPEEIQRKNKITTLYSAFIEHFQKDEEVRQAIVNNYWSGNPSNEITYQTPTHAVWLSTWRNAHTSSGTGLQVRLHPLKGETSLPPTEYWDTTISIEIPNSERRFPWYSYFDKKDPYFKNSAFIETNPAIARPGIEKVYQLLSGKPFPKE